MVIDIYVVNSITYNMLDTSIITGKAYTGNPSASNSVVKRLYLKIFPGEFWYRAPRAKKAKIYGGEIFIRYSNREWPEKKNGPLVGDPGLLSGISNLLKELNLVYADEIQYAPIQHKLKETLTLTVGSNLANEIVNRGWARLIEIKEPVLPAASIIVEPYEIVSDVAVVAEMAIIDATPTESPNYDMMGITTPTISDLYGSKLPPPPVVAPPVVAPVKLSASKKKSTPATK